MANAATPSRSRTPFRLTEADCRLEDFAALVDQTTELADYPHAADGATNVVVYDAAALRRRHRLRSRAGSRSRPSWSGP